MTDKYYTPIPIFDTIDVVITQYKEIRDTENPHDLIRQKLKCCFDDVPQYLIKDYQIALNFLYNYRGSIDTFFAYRRDLERLLQWSWFVHKQSFLKHKRSNIEVFIEFCLKPPKRWIGLKNVARFKEINGKKLPNPLLQYLNIKKVHLIGHPMDGFIAVYCAFLRLPMIKSLTFNNVLIF